MAQVTILVNGKPTVVDETSPGLFGKLGYQYAGGAPSKTAPTEGVIKTDIGTFKKDASGKYVPVEAAPGQEGKGVFALPPVTPLSTAEQTGAPTLTPPTYIAPTLPQRGPAQTLTLPQAPQNNLLQFMAALEQTLDLARQKRLAMQKQFMGRVVEPGAMSATDFASILGNIDVGASRFGERIAQATTQGAQAEADTKQRNYELERNQTISDFEYQRAQGESDYEFQRSQALKQSEQDYNVKLADYENKQQQQKQDRNAINELYVSLAPHVDQSTLDNILNAGSYEAALRIAGPALQKQTNNKFKLEQVGSTVYEIEQDKDGKVVNKRVIVQGEEGGKPIGVPMGNTTVKFTNDELKIIQAIGAQNFSPSFQNKLLNALTASERTKFMRDWKAEQERRGQSIDPETYLEEWAAQQDEEESLF